MDHSRHLGTSSAKSLLRSQFRIAHALLDDAIDRLSLEAVHRCPAGSEASAEVCYAQVVLCEDLSVNGVLGAGKPLALSTWAGRTGLSEIPPLVGAIDWRAWTHRVRLDRNNVRAYALAVYASTDTYIARLPEDALDPTRAETPVCLLNALLLSVSMRRGEIASLLAGSYGAAHLTERAHRKTDEFRHGSGFLPIDAYSVAASAEPVHVKEGIIMACYVVAEVKVTNPDEFEKYAQLAVPNIIAFGGKVLAAGQPDAVEGDWKPERFAIVEFPSVEQAMAWYHSREYSAIIEIRDRGAIFNVILVPGLSG